MKLPLNCDVDYMPGFLTKEEAKQLYDVLISKYKINESRIIINAGGKTIETDSFKILFLTEKLMNLNSYPISVHGKSFVWEGIMAELRSKIENIAEKEFEVAMCLFYPDGSYFAPYHTDQQTSGEKTIIPSLSLGEVREFAFKENSSKKVYSLNLEDGSLLLMKDFCQNRYTHSLIKDPKYKNGRINITFREPGFK